MSVGEQINTRVSPLLFGAVAIALGILVAYLVLDPSQLARVALFAVLFLSGIVAKLAGEVMAITRSLHERVGRLERQGQDSEPRP